MVAAIGRDSMKNAAAILEEFGVTHELRFVSAHRMPHDMVEYGAEADRRGLRALIHGAGAAAHLPGMRAALTRVSVFGVCVPSRRSGESRVGSDGVTACGF